MELVGNGDCQSHHWSVSGSHLSLYSSTDPKVSACNIDNIVTGNHDLFASQMGASPRESQVHVIHISGWKFWNHVCLSIVWGHPGQVGLGGIYS